MLTASSNSSTPSSPRPPEMPSTSTIAESLRRHGPITLELAWFGIRVRIHADDATVTDYVAKQFATAEDSECRPPEATVRNRNVHVRRHAGLLDDLVELGHRHGTVGRRSFKTEVYQQVHGLNDRTVLLKDLLAPDHAFVGSGDGAWLVVCRGEPSGLVVTRLVRELVRDDLLDRGALMFHGAGALTSDGVGVLLAGHSGTGKTSAALRLAGGGGRVLGTDRTLLVPSADRWWIVGLPTSTRLGVGAVSAFGILDRLRQIAPLRAINPFNPDIPEQSYAGMREPKVSLGNGEVEELLGTRFAPAAPATRLVVLEPGAPETFRRRRLSASAARRALVEHLMDPDPDYPDLWLHPRQPAECPGAFERTTERMRLLVSDVAVDRVAWTPRIHCDERVAELITGSTTAEEGDLRSRHRLRILGRTTMYGGSWSTWRSTPLPRTPATPRNCSPGRRSTTTA